MAFWNRIKNRSNTKVVSQQLATTCTQSRPPPSPPPLLHPPPPPPLLHPPPPYLPASSSPSPLEHITNPSKFCSSHNQSSQVWRTRTAHSDNVRLLAPPAQDLSVASPRIRLKDGRHLSYAERGLPRKESKYRIVIVHGFGSSKEMNFNASQDLMEKLGVYFLLYDRAGYGESDPNPRRTVKSEALDLLELADQLGIGPKFYVIGVSMGSYPVWSCLKHIPHRLAGVALVAPVVNYKWRSLPKSLIRKDYRRELMKWAFRISRYAPGLLHWWITHKLFPSTRSVLESNPLYFNGQDVEVLKRTTGFPMLTKDKLRHRKVFNTLRDDFVVGFGQWDFDPADLSNPFPGKESSVHIWHGYEDRVVPSQLHKCILKKQPWIKYHEIPDGGHLIVHYDGVCDAILRALLLGEELQSYKPRPPSVEP